MRVKDVVSQFGTECTIDEDTRSLNDYDNEKREVVYNAQVVENGEHVNRWISYVEDGTVDDIEDRVRKFGNNLLAAYTEFVHYDRARYDPDNKIYEAFIAEVKEKESDFFTESGNFKEKFIVKLEVFRKREF